MVYESAEFIPLFSLENVDARSAVNDALTAPHFPPTTGP
jgi:hypothetical protein